MSSVYGVVTQTATSKWSIIVCNVFAAHTRNMRTRYICSRHRDGTLPPEAKLSFQSPLLRGRWLTRRRKTSAGEPTISLCWHAWCVQRRRKNLICNHTSCDKFLGTDAPTGAHTRCRSSHVEHSVVKERLIDSSATSAERGWTKNSPGLPTQSLLRSAAITTPVPPPALSGDDPGVLRTLSRRTIKRKDSKKV